MTSPVPVMAICTQTSRRGLLIAAACLGWIAVAQAQIYPNRPVKIIVPTVAGGTVDVITRLMANDLSARLGASFFVDNRSGAGNTLGSREAARSDADGYTLLMSSASGQVISPLVYKTIDYDPIKSFAPIGLVAEGSIILVVNPSLPFQSLQDLIAHAKANPGKLNYGSAGTGTVPHLTGELFKSTAGVDLVHVPYRGGALSIADVIGGNVQLTFEASSPLLQHIRDGRLRELAVMSKAHPGPPRRADRGRERLLRARGHDLDGAVRTGRHRRRHRRQAQRRSQRRAALARAHLRARQGRQCAAGRPAGRAHEDDHHRE
jgi:tripartite-type tricarboxylate transporter receptor subunit TctC